MDETSYPFSAQMSAADALAHWRAPWGRHSPRRGARRAGLRPVRTNVYSPRIDETYWALRCGSVIGLAFLMPVGDSGVER